MLVLLFASCPVHAFGLMTQSDCMELLDLLRCNVHELVARPKNKHSALNSIAARPHEALHGALMAWPASMRRL